MVILNPIIPNVKQVVITTDQTAKAIGNENVIIGVAGKIQQNFWNYLIDLFTPLYYKKVEVHPQQGQSIIVRIRDLSKALNVSNSEIYDLSKGDTELDSFIKLNNTFVGIGKIEEFRKNNNSILFDAFKKISFIPTSLKFENFTNLTKDIRLIDAYKKLHLLPPEELMNHIEDLANIIADERMQNPKMQSTVIKAVEIIRKNEQSFLPVLDETYVRKTKDSYGFIIDKENKIYIRTEEIGKGTYKRVKSALQLPELKEKANVAIKGDQAEEEVEAEQEALKLLQGCRHIIKPPKFQIVTKTKKSEPKYILMQKRLAGDGFKILNAKPMEQLRFFRDCAEGLGDINDKGLIHSDVKLANFLIGDDGEGYVHDFGLLTAPQQGIGFTRLYASPEIVNARPEKQAVRFSSKLDSYGLGLSILAAIQCNNPKEVDVLLTNFHNGLKNKPDKLKFFFNQIKDNLKNSTDNPNDKKIKSNMLDVAEQLLNHNPHKRLSCKEAAIKLTSYQEQALAKGQ